MTRLRTGNNRARRRRWWAMIASRMERAVRDANAVFWVDTPSRARSAGRGR
jgi:hypothetical protein